MKHTSLKVWEIADELTIAIQDLTLNSISSIERYESGPQIRRSIKSVKANIVEGFSRRAYKKDFIHFLIIAKGSADETIDHLDTLYKTKSLKDKKKYQEIRRKLIQLSYKLYLFINAVKQNHKPTK